FTAAVQNAADPRVRWSATGGTIDQSGLYTAGQTAGTFTVTATSVEDARVSGSANVTISAVGLEGTYVGTGAAIDGEDLVPVPFVHAVRIVIVDVGGALQLQYSTGFDGFFFPPVGIFTTTTTGSSFT